MDVVTIKDLVKWQNIGQDKFVLKLLLTDSTTIQTIHMQAQHMIATLSKAKNSRLARTIIISKRSNL